MTKQESIDVIIFGSRVSIVTDEPEQIRKVFDILNTELIELSGKYQGVKPNLVLILQCLRLLEKNLKLEQDLDGLVKERESLDTTLKGVLLSID